MTISPTALSNLAIGGPVGFRRRLQRMGPTFIKIGQVLALRPDLVPQAYCDELMHLLDRVPPFPWAEAREILREDLARDPSETFAWVNPKPVAAGSLAQVHRGELWDGTAVAIKIQRPNIRERVEADLEQARDLAGFLERVTFLASSRALMHELREWMNEELDMERELANVTRLRELAAGSRIEVIPRPYPHLSSKRILVLTYVDGVRMTDILGEVRSREDGRSPRAEARGVDLRELAENLFEATLRQIFSYQFFHADLHPGNLFALSRNRIGYVDFGLCAELDPLVRRQQLRYFQAVYAGRTDQIVKALSELLVPTAESDFEAFRRDATARTDKWVRERDAKPLNSANRRSPTGQWLIDLMRLARAHHMEVPPRTLSLYRALLTAESVANELHVSVDFQEVSHRFFRRFLTILDPVKESLWQTQVQNINLFRGFSEAYLELVCGSLRAMTFLLERVAQSDRERPSGRFLENLADGVAGAIDLSTKSRGRMVEKFYRAYKRDGGGVASRDPKGRPSLPPPMRSGPPLMEVLFSGGI